MQFKVVPPAPDSLSFVREAQRAVPLVPGTEDDCCARLMRGVDLPARDDAREWLTFLRALGLVSEGERGYHRERVTPDRETLARAFRERVYAAEVVLDVLSTADEPLSASAVFERVADEVPAWERQRHDDYRTVWTERVGRILEWAVLLGLAEREDDGYVAT